MLAWKAAKKPDGVLQTIVPDLWVRQRSATSKGGCLKEYYVLALLLLLLLMSFMTIVALAHHHG